MLYPCAVRSSLSTPGSSQSVHSLSVEDLPRACQQEHVYPSTPSTVTFHFLRDGLGQVPSKLAGLGLFAAATHAPGYAATAVSAAATFAGAASGATMAYRIAERQFGKNTVAGNAAIALSTVAGGAIGVAFAVGNFSAIVTVGSATLGAGVLLGTARLVAHARGQNVSSQAKAVVMLSAVGLGAASYVIGGFVLPDPWGITQHASGTDGTFMARQAGAIAEAILVEVFKEALGHCGPSFDRKGLTFASRITATLKGLPAFVAAAVLINGMGGTRLLSPTDGVGGNVNFEELWQAVLLSCLVNAVRGLSNSLAVKSVWEKGRQEGVPANPHDFQPRGKSAGEVAASISNKTAVRYLLILARNAIYLSLRETGYSIQTAALIAQASYTSIGAQWRDLFADLMAGDGWTPAAMHTEMVEAFDQSLSNEGLHGDDLADVAQVDVALTVGAGPPAFPAIHMPPHDVPAVGPQMAPVIGLPASREKPDPPLGPPAQRGLSLTGLQAFRGGRLHTHTQPYPQPQ